ncbi:papilin-like [Penaeus japonicus]|uniref:papilin-like n=1 Tax=Penaeus japonicus TaxID=27405 RepID=UPI001C70C1D2|nr:papilin-like [Penaeus japonicus]
MDTSKTRLWRCLCAVTLLTALAVVVESSHNNHHNHKHHRVRHHHDHQNDHLEDDPLEDDPLKYDSAWEEWSSQVRGKRQYDPTENEVEQGPWGHWGSPGPCSRSCGGGVKVSLRECRAPSPADCTGRSKKYESCNVDPCPGGPFDYRAEQCAKFNSVLFEGKYHRWVPYIDPEKKSLRNTTGHFYLNGNWRIDVPRSFEVPGSSGVGVGSTTFHYERRTGQEGVSVFSPEVLRAKGPTTEALYVVLLYQEPNRGVKYEYSVPLEVTQAEAETYDWLFGTYGQCSVSCGGGHKSRNVTCARTSDLAPVAEYLCDPRQRPDENMTCNEQPCQARWELGAWTPCTSSCGQSGFQFRTVFCSRPFGEEGLSAVLEDSLCLQEEEEGVLGSSAGVLGSSPLDSRPPSVRECNRMVACPAWHVGAWEPCNKLCGPGRQIRKVTCHRRSGQRVEALPDEDCLTEKPEGERACETVPCGGVDWVAGDWSGCGHGCGQLVETRPVLCVGQKGGVVPVELCEMERRPPISRECSDVIGCEFRWYASEWSQCSTRRGEGLRSRHVLCGAWDEESGLVAAVPEDKCVGARKMAATEACDGAKEVEEEEKAGGEEEGEGKKEEKEEEEEEEEEEKEGEWFAGPWSKCTKECGGGTKTRKILCYKNGSQATIGCGELDVE